MSAQRTATVMAYSPETNSSRGVIQEREGQKPLALLADMDEIFTLERCQRLLQLAQQMDTRTVTKISVTDFDKNKEYRYSARHNRLTIWEDGLPVYENWNGTITRDREALADCLL